LIGLLIDERADTWTFRDVIDLAARPPDHHGMPKEGGSAKDWNLTLLKDADGELLGAWRIISRGSSPAWVAVVRSDQVLREPGTRQRRSTATRRPQVARAIEHVRMWHRLAASESRRRRGRHDRSRAQLGWACSAPILAGGSLLACCRAMPNERRPDERRCAAAWGSPGTSGRPRSISKRSPARQHRLLPYAIVFSAWTSGRARSGLWTQAAGRLVLSQSPFDAGSFRRP
jgi:hypothetical protein